MRRKLDLTFTTESPWLLFIDDNFLGHLLFFAVLAHCFDISFPLIHVATEAWAEEAHVILTDANRKLSICSKYIFSIKQNKCIAQWPISTLNCRTSGFELNCFWHCLQASLTGPRASGWCWGSCGFVGREAGTYGEMMFWFKTGTVLWGGLNPWADGWWGTGGWGPVFGLW